MLYGFRFFYILLLGFLLVSCTTIPDTDENVHVNTLTGEALASEMADLPETYQSTIDEDEKVKQALERRKQVDNIRKGDYMMTKNNPSEAIMYYLPVLEEIPGDIVLEKKIALAYYAMKDWENAYLHFIRVPYTEMSTNESLALLESLFLMDATLDREREIHKFPLSTADLEYYSTLIRCYDGANQCANVLLAYDGADPRLTDLRSRIENASTISDDPLYRDFLLATKLYEQKMYRLSGMFASEILSANPEYQEVKKLRGFSLYELGKYSDARDALLAALEYHPDDLEIIVRLGEVFSFLGEYTTANLYFNNAIMAGYTPKTQIERRLAYNYAKIGDKEGMEKVLSYLLQEKDATEDDYAVAVSLAFEQGENTRAYAWAFEGMQRFANSKTLFPLYLQSLRLSGNLHQAQLLIDRLPAETKNLPLIQLEQATLYYQQDRLSDAKRIFAELAKFDPNADFAIEAEHYLLLIQAKEKMQNTSGSGVTQNANEFY